MTRLMLALTVSLMVSLSAADLENQMFSLVDSYWKACDSVHKNADLSALDNVRLQADVIADQITSALDRGDSSEYKAFVNLYAQHVNASPELAEPFNLVADQIIEYGKTKDITPDSYFPGYGYADPKYVYRRGNELENEVLSVYWKHIERTFETGKTFRIKLEVGANANFGADAEIKEVGAKESLNIGGNIKEVVECEVTMKDTVTTTCTVKYQKRKTWFTLLKAEKTWLGMSHGDWVECGKTYQVFDEESGLPVVEIPGTLSPVNTVVP